jgi:hypothetical protein
MFQIEHSGLNESKALLESLFKIAGVRRSADLNAKERQEGGGDNNAEILDHLAKGGRDFVTPSKDAQREIDQACLREIEKGLKKYESTASQGRITPSKAMTQSKAKQVMGKALVEAAKEWNKEITRRIEEGDWTGDGDRKLSEEYEKHKQNKYKFAYPIGKATGQVLDNVGPGTRNIKLRNN